MNQHFLQALDDVYEKMFGENNLKSGGDLFPHHSVASAYCGLSHIISVQ
jgi:hypothetical protein